LRKTVVLLTAWIATGAICTAPAHATFPGENGKIAFSSKRDDPNPSGCGSSCNYEIYTINPDGTGLTRLTVDPGFDGFPSWSADGQKIAFSCSTGICVMNADGTGRVAVPSCVCRQPTWSPDGTKLAVVDGSYLATINVDGTNRTDIVGMGVFDSGPTWSPDGSRIAFEEFNRLRTVKPDGTDVQTVGSDIEIEPDWSPDGTRIAMSDQSQAGVIFSIRPDGTGLTQISPGSGREPSWSPDQAQVAFEYGNDIAVSAVGGSTQTLLTSDTVRDMNRAPAWQPLPPPGPSADLLALLTDSPDPVAAGGELHYTAQAKNLVGPADATNVALTVHLPASVYFVSATPTQGSCSQSAGVVTCNLGTVPKGSTASADIDVEPTLVISNTTISASASVSATEADSVPGNNSDSETTTVTPGGYGRPMGATPIRASLVPAYKTCGPEATLQHGSPLSYPSCGNPQQTSGYLTVGTPDANGRTSNSVGSASFRAIGEGPPVDPNNGDQADIGVDVSISDVRQKSDLSDYAGELQVDSTVRITDHDNGAGGFTTATLQDRPFDFTVPCAATASTTTGGTCALHTTAEAIAPGTVKERQRMVWQLGQVRVLDGGPDGAASTANNTLFEVQGVFVP
jgi:uncharacterized repeat protein (TIGR01451 family)